MKQIHLLRKVPLCLKVDPTSDILDAGAALAAKNRAEKAVTTKPLGELACIVGTTVNPHAATHAKTVFQYIDLAEVDEVTGAIMTYREVPGQHIGSSKVRFSFKDVLFAKIRPSIDNKKIAYVYQEVENGVASTEFLVLRARDGVNPLFIYAALRSDAFTKSVVDQCSGDTGRQRISSSVLLSIPIPWPEQDERDRISENVASYFASLAATMALRQQMIETSTAVLGLTSMRTAEPRRKRTKAG